MGSISSCAKDSLFDQIMGRVDPNVVVSYGKGMGGVREFSFPVLLPERVHETDLRHSDLNLVQVISCNGPGGMFERVHNHRQVKDSACYFDGEIATDVNKVVQHLGNHGACAAFVKLQPTVRVSIPVFVVNEAQLKELKELRDKDTRVTLVQCDSNQSDSSNKEEANVSSCDEAAEVIL